MTHVQTFLFKKVKSLKKSSLLYQDNILIYVIFQVFYEHFGDRMVKTIGYIRVSTDEQAKEGVSLENQEAKIWANCDLKDLKLLEIVEDAGVSAKNLRRPGAQKVIEMAQKKMVDAVVVYKLDRMFRSIVDALETTKQFDKWGCPFNYTCFKGFGI